jgi:hypothetical protein
MNTLHNFDRLADIELPHAVDLVADVLVAEQEPERFTSVTYAESGAAGEEFLLRAAG